MIEIIQQIIQYCAIGCFVILTIIGVIVKDYNYGVLLNGSLVLLYTALYIKPFIK